MKEPIQNAAINTTHPQNYHFKLVNEQTLEEAPEFAPTEQDAVAFFSVKLGIPLECRDHDDLPVDYRLEKYALAANGSALLNNLLSTTCVSKALHKSAHS